MTRSDDQRRKDRLGSGARSELFSAIAPDVVLWPFHLVLSLLRGTGKAIHSILSGF
ncbi:hypothetical protein [Planococcus lenghuensis]|uniref:hypothetical protein n=1 Tax=Planococcus lenghuensis TaxID=2213202 RepID=UPI0012EC4687|nr:hypothetical protein [Planococcus lenghuensis]